MVIRPGFLHHRKICQALSSGSGEDAHAGRDLANQRDDPQNRVHVGPIKDRAQEMLECTDDKEERKSAVSTIEDYTDQADNLIANLLQVVADAKVPSRCDVNDEDEDKEDEDGDDEIH